MVQAAYGWCCSRYLYIHTSGRLEYLFFLQVVRKMTVIPSKQIARNRGSNIPHGRGQMLGTSRDAQCLMARNPDGPRTQGCWSPSDFSLQPVTKLELTLLWCLFAKPIAVGSISAHEAPRRQNHCLRASFSPAFFKWKRNLILSSLASCRFGLSSRCGTPVHLEWMRWESAKATITTWHRVSL